MLSKKILKTHKTVVVVTSYLVLSLRSLQGKSLSLVAASAVADLVLMGKIRENNEKKSTLHISVKN